MSLPGLWDKEEGVRKSRSTVTEWLLANRPLSSLTFKPSTEFDSLRQYFPKHGLQPFQLLVSQTWAFLPSFAFRGLQIRGIPEALGGSGASSGLAVHAICFYGLQTGLQKPSKVTSSKTSKASVFHSEACEGQLGRSPAQTSGASHVGAAHCDPPGRTS